MGSPSRQTTTGVPSRDSRLFFNLLLLVPLLHCDLLVWNPDQVFFFSLKEPRRQHCLQVQEQETRVGAGLELFQLDLRHNQERSPKVLPAVLVSRPKSGAQSVHLLNALGEGPLDRLVGS